MHLIYIEPTHIVFHGMGGLRQLKSFLAPNYLCPPNCHEISHVCGLYVPLLVSGETVVNKRLGHLD